MPAFEQKHWFAELLQHLIRALGRRQFELVVKTPDRDYIGPAQIADLRRLASSHSDYTAAIVIPAEPEGTRDELASISQQSRMPVVFVDVEPFPSDLDYPGNSCFVGCDAATIGELAAEYVIRRLVAINITAPQILIVGCRIQQGRQRAFAKSIRQRLPGAQIAVHDDGDFVRDRATTIVSAYLMNAAKERRPLHAVFCTNDEMALGAVDALQSSASTMWKLTFVVGVDGTGEARALIDSKRSAFKATVCQDAYRVAEIVAELLTKKLDGRDIRTRTIVAPQLYSVD